MRRLLKTTTRMGQPSVINGMMDWFVLSVVILSTRCSALQPNFIVIFADDLGFGDLGCYGHPSSLTPNIDRLAANGLRFTDFYTTCPVCSPSRASLLTGRYQTRSGIYPGVLYPGSRGGLPLNETTIAELLKPLGYATAAVGKWHLGVGPGGMYLPTHQGFDQYLGIPYSHDMGPCWNLTCFPPDVKCFGLCDVGTVAVPLMLQDVIKKQPVNFLTLENSYSQFMSTFIFDSASRSKPFFLYYPSHHTHYPQYAGPKAAGASLRGPFGDALLEFDSTIGHILDVLEQTQTINNTFIFFTADNGPELMRMTRGGNAGPLKCGKGTTFEGGMREPAIAFWPGVIAPGVTHELASTLDLLPTIARLSGASLPQVQLDGVDMTDLMLTRGKSKRGTMMFYPTDPSEKTSIFALRLGKYKAHFYTRGATHSSTGPDPDCQFALKAHDPPLVFDLESDPSENYPLSLDTEPALHGLLDKILEAKAKFEASMVFGESQVGRGSDPALAPCCAPLCQPKPSCCQC
ncbi:arylsulfatase A [Gadus macrocephalus]|uniref:arylsulfatase A n=1 Tax=Gadus macrocephalus TaxID=80720 RepID=UPI0028CB5EFF|nr:arylsulfatase A [Gadus macrocephalus]